MKIIEESDRYVERTWNVQCTGKGWTNRDKIPCGSILEVSLWDLERYGGQDYPIVRSPTVNFVCIKCGCRTDIPATHDIVRDHFFSSSIKAMA